MYHIPSGALRTCILYEAAALIGETRDRRPKQQVFVGTDAAVVQPYTPDTNHRCSFCNNLEGMQTWRESSFSVTHATYHVSGIPVHIRQM